MNGRADGIGRARSRESRARVARRRQFLERATCIAAFHGKIREEDRKQEMETKRERERERERRSQKIKYLNVTLRKQ